MFLVPLIDLPAGRRRTALVGCGVVVGGLVFWKFGAGRLAWAMVAVGWAIVLWAGLHKTRGLPVTLSSFCEAGNHEACAGLYAPGVPCLCPCHGTRLSNLNSPSAT